jgi:glutamine synthetase
MLDETISRADLEKSIRNDEIDTVLVVFPDWYGRLLGKRVTSRYFADHVAEEGMHACDYLVACDLEMTPAPGYKFTSWESGYGDFHCVPDFATLRRAAWLPRTAMILCDLETDAHKPVEVSPRRMLTRQIQRAREAGFAVMAASEFELYAFNETYESARAKNYHDLQKVGSYIEDYHILQGTREEPLMHAIRKALLASGIPVESTKGEWGPGQQELNMRYSEVLRQSDWSVVFKHAAKEIAHHQSKAVTFMAKWDENFAGSSMHVHVSLWDGAAAANLFAGNHAMGRASVSDNFRWFLGGWLKHAREMAVCYAPNVSSYKRYQSASFAPTTLAWSYDNRTAGFRVVGHGPSLRIECRIPGADANPYVAYSAALASGLEGIQKRIEPPAEFKGDLYQARELPRIPVTLREGILEFEKSDLARRAFGEDVVEHYLHFLRTEQEAFDRVVTCWERARFFERI